jgi:hypothetical protein
MLSKIGLTGPDRARRADRRKGQHMASGEVSMLFAVRKNPWVMELGLATAVAAGVAVGIGVDRAEAAGLAVPGPGAARALLAEAPAPCDSGLGLCLQAETNARNDNQKKATVCGPGEGLPPCAG